MKRLLTLLGATLASAATWAAGVAWLPAANDADIDRALAQARAEKKPLLLYWGASWCPPCNQLKATLFNRQDFIERSRHFVAVQVDGDLPGAQKLGGRFKVRGYPTMILMAADGQEITRLPGEVDAPQALAVLQLGLAGGRPAKAVLADARAGRPVPANEWRLLAFYAWDVDEERLVPAAERAGLLAQLAAACPASEADSATRLLLKALAESDDGQGLKPDAALRQRVRTLLADAAASRRQMDVLVNFADDITKALAPTPGPERVALVQAFDTALARLAADASLSRGDRWSALHSRVALARLDAPKTELKPTLPAPLLAQVRDEAVRQDRDITDGYERQAVITAAAYTLAQAGLWDASGQLLNSNLAKSHSPYYLMLQLAGNARKLGRTDEALGWYEKAHATSVGPATRLEWGARHVSALVELAPKDSARIERAVRLMLTDAAADSAAFHERSARSLQRVAQKLAEWNALGEHDALIARLQAQLAPACAALPAADPQRATCSGLLAKAAGRAKG